MVDVETESGHAVILLAEDDGEFRSLLGATLEREGYNVMMAQDGRQLFEMIEQGLEPHSPFPRPDLVLSDVRMPGPSGLDSLFALRRRDSRTPVVLMTAYGDDATRERAKRLGASAVLEKPFDVQDLLRIVRSLLRGDPPSGPVGSEGGNP